MKKKVPRPRTDEQAEAFLAQDLSKLDFSQFKTARFEFERKDEQINIRVPKALLAAVKARAKARGIPIRGSFGRPWNRQSRRRSSVTVWSIGTGPLKPKEGLSGPPSGRS